MEKIYVIAKFKLNKWIKIEEWKKLSDFFGTEFVWENGFILRDSATDENGNVYCIIKWENIESQKAFSKKLDEKDKEKPEIMKEFWRLVDMETFSMETLNII